MTVPVTATRQITFCTDPSDAVSEKSSIRKGSIHLPIIDDDYSVTNQSNGDNNLSPHQIPSDDPSSSSSPIYGSKSALQRFKDEYHTKGKVKKPPSILDESSELEILSDVGLAGDSDSEVVPIVTPLSISAKSKLKRKEPRIKVPGAKVDNSEPTIEEETTQDIDLLANAVPVNNHTSNPGVRKNPQFKLRSDTVVVDKLDVSNLRSIKKSIKQNSTSAQTTQISPSAKQKEDTLKESKEELKVINKAGVVTEPESSFYESDWQPRNDEDDLNRSKNSQKVPIKEDKTVISRKYDSEIKPALRNKRINAPIQPYKKRPRSSGDEATPSKEKGPAVRKISEHNTPSTKSNFATQKTSQSTTFSKNQRSRPKSAETVSPSQETPRISELQIPVNKHPPVVNPNKNERVSGIPKKGAAKIQDSKEPISFSDPTNVTTPRHPPVAKKPGNMATSDGYDYESETFEEILQERNAMVKAERTYQRRIKQLEEELKGMINQCQALSDENKELRKTIDTLKKKSDSKSEENNSNNNNPDTVALAARVAKLETEKENLEKINETFRQSLKDNDSKRKQTDVVFVENTKLKNKNSELEKKVISLEQDLDTMAKKIQELKVDTTGTASVMNFKQKELEVALSEIQYENKSLTAKVVSLEKDKKALANNLEEKRVELNEVMRAMQNETASESELKNSKQKLENAQVEIDSVKQELADMRKSLEESEESKEKLRSIISQKDTDVKKVKQDQEHKDRVIVDLKNSVEKLKEEIQKLQESATNTKELEKDTNALKSRIGSLKVEIASSIQENLKLKREREEFTVELNRLRNENVASNEAITESKRYFRKWENERDARNKAEVELAKKQEEVESLDSRVKDGGNKINVLYTRLRALEDDRERYKGPNAQELETSNKILHDENKKLRQMLVERNIELTNKQNEKETMQSRMNVLERKQKDADVRVKQLSGWVSSLDGDSQTSARDGSKKEQSREHLPPRDANKSLGPPPKTVTHLRSKSPNDTTVSSQNRSRISEPQIAFVSPRSRKKGVKRNAHHSMTPPPGWEKSHNRLGDDNDVDRNEHSNHTPLSLPMIDSKSYTPPDHPSGYFQMYKDKLKRMNSRRF